MNITFIGGGNMAQAIAGGVSMLLPDGWTSMQTLTLLAALIMTGVVCILMGCGIPTTANYIIMVTVAAPTLVQLGVEPLVAHFFVFYYGVLADITPPVALAAYAAAGGMRAIIMAPDSTSTAKTDAQNVFCSASYIV